MSKQKDFNGTDKRLKKRGKLITTKISKEAEIERKSSRNQKRITLRHPAKQSRNIPEMYSGPCETS